MSDNSKKYGLVIKPPTTEEKSWNKGIAQLDKNGTIISSVQTKVVEDKVESIDISLEDKTIVRFTKDSGYINGKKIITDNDNTESKNYLLERTNKDENGIYTKIIHRNRNTGLISLMGELKNRENGLYKVKLVNLYDGDGKFTHCLGERLIYDEDESLKETQVLDVVCCKDVDIENKEDSKIEITKDVISGDLVIKIAKKSEV